MTLIREESNGVKIEYRLGPYDPDYVALEYRQLRPDGRPHPDGWYPVPDAERVRLQADGSDIIQLLSAEHAVRGA